MRACIHRGTKEIGGTCIELEAKGSRLVLDIGLPLETELSSVDLPPVSGFSKFDPSLLGVFISHPHLDHYGLAQKLQTNPPILIGSAAFKIINAANRFLPNKITFDNVIEVFNQTPITLGPFTLTPYLVDHSAYDSYGLLVEADGKRLFYSGDFRGHGRKGKLLDRIISNPPDNIDVLLMEGSTLGRLDTDSEYPTESVLEKKFCKVFQNTSGMVLVWCSGQNIDRLVTIYRACRDSGRQFVADMYTASILRAIDNPKLPIPGWKGFRVYLPWFQKQKIIKQELFEFSKSFKRWRIYQEQLKVEAGKSVVLFRPSMLKDLKKADCLDGAKLIYSLWSGYLKDARYQSFLGWLNEKEISIIHCHTSGHAPVADLKRFAKALFPKMLVPVHTFEAARFIELFQNVELKNDGVWWDV
jgi:ribonuclease J